MKTLYMKPIYLLMVLTMMMGFTFTACSSDDPEGSVEFPALKELSGNAGETLELSFSAGTDWTLSSNK